MIEGGGQRKRIREQQALAPFRVKDGAFPRPYRVTGTEAKELGERRGISGKLGKMCEETVLGIWGDEIRLEENDRRELLDAVSVLQAGLFQVRSVRAEKNEDVEPAYQVLGEMGDIWEGGEPENESLRILLTGIDRICNTNLMEIYQGLPLEGGVISGQVRYLIDAALILGKELCESGRPDGRVVVNVNFAGGQFDGILVKWLAEEADFDFGEYLSAGGKWEIYEVKFPVRVRYTTGNRNMGRVTSYHLREFYRRIQRLTLSWVSKERSLDFPFPVCCHFVYLKGPSDTQVLDLNLDYWFFRNWMEYLERESLNGRFDGLGVDIDTLVLVLKKAIDKEEKRMEARLKEEERAREARKERRGDIVGRLAKDLENGMERRPLFSLEEPKGVGKKVLAKMLEAREE